MKRSRFTDQQIAFTLQQAEQGTQAGEVTRKMGINEQTFYRWKKKFGSLMPSEVRKFRKLEKENARLRRLVAGLSLEKEILQEVIRKSSKACPGTGTVDLLRTCYHVSIRRATQTLRGPRSTLYYRP
jgi:putative transposase